MLNLLENYKKQARELEREINPDRAEDAERSSYAINRALKEIKDSIPKEDRDEFYDDILESEDKIVTAGKIAGKIKELCEQLSELDPGTYYETCKSDEDSPKWQKELDKDLTEEQRLEINEDIEKERISNLSAGEKTTEKAKTIDSLASQAAHMRSKLEIQNDPDALTKAQAWYDAEVAIVNQKYS